jgi:hypothetical protein
MSVKHQKRKKVTYLIIDSNPPSKSRIEAVQRKWRTFSMYSCSDTCTFSDKLLPALEFLDDDHLLPCVPMCLLKMFLDIATGAGSVFPWFVTVNIVYIRLVVVNPKEMHSLAEMASNVQILLGVWLSICWFLY